MKKSYIIIVNRKSSRENKENDFHLERISDYDTITDILSSNGIWSYEFGELIIVTDDKQLLTKYIVTINLEEFKLLCKVQFDSTKIRINPLHSFGYDEYVFEYFLKIQNEEIISASMDWDFDTSYIHDIGNYASCEIFKGWKEDCEYFYNEKD